MVENRAGHPHHHLDPLVGVRSKCLLEGVCLAHGRSVLAVDGLLSLMDLGLGMVACGLAGLSVVFRNALAGSWRCGPQGGVATKSNAHPTMRPPTSKRVQGSSLDLSSTVRGRFSVLMVTECLM